jgi:hypothetical protein
MENKACHKIGTVPYMRVYTGNEVISMLDNIFAEVGRHIFNKSSATSFCAIEMGGL